MRSVLRGLSWVVSDALNLLWPATIRQELAAVADDRDWWKSRAEFLSDYITAEELAQVEEEKEVLEAGDLYGYEPPLTDDELIAVRGLIQERYQVSPASSSAAGDPAGVEPDLPPVAPPAGTSPNPSIWSQLSGGPW